MSIISQYRPQIFFNWKGKPSNVMEIRPTLNQVTEVTVTSNATPDSMR